MNNQEKARVLALVLGGEQSKINEIFGLKAEEIVSAHAQATPYQVCNTKVKVKTTNQGVREFNYNRQSLAVAISGVLGAGPLNASNTGTAVAAALTEAGLTVDETDIVVTPLGTTAVKIAASDSNVRYYGSVNVTLGEGSPEVPEVPVKNYIVSMDPTPQLYVGNYSTPVAIGDVLENGVVKSVTDKVAKTITLTLEGNYIGPVENIDLLLVPMYLGDADFYAEAVAQQAAGVNPNTPFVRIMLGDYPADVALSSLLQSELLNGKFTSPIALSSPNSTMVNILSVDNFATSGDAYSFILVNNIVFPA